jgi:hypothetical protein
MRILIACLFLTASAAEKPKPVYESVKILDYARA